MSDQQKITVYVEPEDYLALRQQLLPTGVSFSAWVREQMTKAVPRPKRKRQKRA